MSPPAPGHLPGNCRQAWCRSRAPPVTTATLSLKPHPQASLSFLFLYYGNESTMRSHCTIRELYCQEILVRVAAHEKLVLSRQIETAVWSGMGTHDAWRNFADGPVLIVRPQVDCEHPQHAIRTSRTSFGTTQEWLMKGLAQGGAATRTSQSYLQQVYLPLWNRGLTRKRSPGATHSCAATQRMELSTWS